MLEWQTEVASGPYPQNIQGLSGLQSAPGIRNYQYYDVHIWPYIRVCMVGIVWIDINLFVSMLN